MALTISAFTKSNVRETENSRLERHFFAFLLNSANGNHEGMYFTVLIVSGIHGEATARWNLQMGKTSTNHLPGWDASSNPAIASSASFTNYKRGSQYEHEESINERLTVSFLVLA